MPGSPVIREHPLLDPAVILAIERAASAHYGRPWTSIGFTDLTERAAHPAGIHRGRLFSVFAKLATEPSGAAQFAAEVRGLDLIRSRAHVITPVPVARGVTEAGGRFLLLLEALPEREPRSRTREDWRAIGRALAALHQVHDEHFGLAGPGGFFGPVRQDSRPVPSNRWADFYAERRLAPMLRLAADSGHLPGSLAAGVAGILPRLPGLCGPQVRPALLHGDAQQHNFVSTPEGAAMIDPCPYFGHPEVDLALLGYFQPVPADVLDGYRELAPVDPGLPGRTELWRMFAYLAVIAADGTSPLGREFTSRLAGAVARYA